MMGEPIPPLYFRTRAELLDALRAMLSNVRTNALIAWDFPFGYPSGSGMGGGQDVASRLFDMVEDGPDDTNNRFLVADVLNRQIGSLPGPFWGRPATVQTPDVGEKKPDFGHHDFSEFRIVEERVRRAGHRSIQSVWKLFTTGSVGGQAIVGLAAIERLNRALRPARPCRFWPFDTGWDHDLDGVIHVECWPSMIPFDHIDHPIRDAQQVAASRDLISHANITGDLTPLLGRPPDLTPAELHAVETEEGWIMGFPHVC